MKIDTKQDIEPEWKVKKNLLLINKKTVKYTKFDVITVFEFLSNTDLHPQKIADETIFTARQIKKLRYIQKHATEQEFNILFRAKYAISSIEKYIKNRIKKQKGQKIKSEPKRKNYNANKNYGNVRGKPNKSKSKTL